MAWANPLFKGAEATCRAKPFISKSSASSKTRSAQPGLGLVGAHLAQQLLERVNHRQREGDFQSRAHVHLEPRVHVVEVDVVVRDDRDLRITGVVERLAKERLVVCEAAVANVLAGADSDLVGVVLPAAKRGERLADDDLRGGSRCRCAHIVCPGGWPLHARFQAGRSAALGSRRRPPSGDRMHARCSG